MNIIPAPLLEQFFVDSNGKPLSGGKLYSYKAGTNEPKDTYVDNETLITNTNPVILNSSGSCRLFILTNNDETGVTTEAYKFVLYDKDDNLIWSQDNIVTAIGQTGTPGGPPGIQGEIGPTGPVGPVGPRGNTGQKGDLGATGDIGLFTEMWRVAGEYTFNIPLGVTKIFYELGAGGQGCYEQNSYGTVKSGRAGQIKAGQINVTPGNTINITVGAGGAANGNGGNTIISGTDFTTITASAVTNTSGFQTSYVRTLVTTLDVRAFDILPGVMFGESSLYGDGGDIYKYGNPNGQGNCSGGGSDIPETSEGTSSGVVYSVLGTGAPGICVFQFTKES